VIVGQYRTGKVETIAQVGIVNVYSIGSVKDKVDLWEKIGQIMSNSVGIAWCMVGDFNAVRNPNERQGVGQAKANRSEMNGFNNFIVSNQLLDIPTTGRKFMWCRPNGTTKSRLDRALVFDN